MAAPIAIKGYSSPLTGWRYLATCRTCDSQWATYTSKFHRLIEITEKHLKESKRCANS